MVTQPEVRAGGRRRVPVYAFILGLIFLSTLILYFDRVNISLLVPTLERIFHWNDAEVGLALSAFFLGYTIFQIPGGLWADKSGGKRPLAVGAAWWSVFTMLSAFGVTIPLMSLFRFGMGMGEGVNFPADTQLVAQWIPKKHRSRATGFNLSAIALGPLIATPLTIWILTSLGWRMVFVVYGLIGLAWVVAWAIFGRSRPEDHPSVSAEEINIIRAPEAKVEAEARQEPFRTWSLWGMCISYFFLLYTLYLFLSWLPTYLVQARHFSTASLALVGTIPWAVAFLTMNVGGWLIDGMISRGKPAGSARRLLIYVGLVGSAVFAVLGADAPGASMALALISISMGFMGLCFSPYWALPIDYAPNNPGGASGLMNTWGNIAGIVAPAVTGFIVTDTGSWSMALYISAGLAVVGAIILWTASLDRRKNAA
ncbi:MAG: MFS transporter [Firmicutes bacterium]|nr:MFS transporter [Bacillota bacterium]